MPLFVLAVIVVGFIAQMVVQQVWREPYPGVFQPRFGVVSPAGTVVVLEPTVLVTYVDGSTATFDHLDAMVESKSEPAVVFTSAFGPDSPRRESVDTISWLEHRLSELHDGTRPQDAVIEWGQVTYALDEQTPPSTRIVDRNVITFGGPRD